MVVEVVYLLLISLISIYGIQRSCLFLESLSHRPAVEDRARPPLQDPLPQVLIQLPIYDEDEVAPRLIASLEGLDWPRDRFQVQVLDDSPGATSGVVSRAVADLASGGVDVVHVCREHRRGYKAGALAEGLERSKAPLIAVFDADFEVPADFLRRTVTEMSDGTVAMVQARWGFRNRQRSLLTRAQARLLDGHFCIEHRVRSQAGRFFNFNGTAGLWRRSAIEDSGGWRSETVTEDLELSIRAWLRGWRFVFLEDLVAPSDLPERFRALRSQQRRWIAGTIHTLVRHLATVLRSDPGPTVRTDLLLALSGNFCSPLLVALSLWVPLVWSRRDADASGLLWADLPFFFLATISVMLFYGGLPGNSRLLGRGLEVLAVMGLGLGLVWHNSRAVLTGLLGGMRIFERTPKGSAAIAVGGVTAGECLFFLYLVVVSGVAMTGEGRWSVPLLGSMALASGWQLFGALKKR